MSISTLNEKLKSSLFISSENKSENIIKEDKYYKNKPLNLGRSSLLGIQQKVYDQYKTIKFNRLNASASYSNLKTPFGSI